LSKSEGLYTKCKECAAAVEGAKWRAIAKAQSAESIDVYMFIPKLKVYAMLSGFEGSYTKGRSHDILYSVLHVI
jgi:hypothetical protein